MNESRGPLLSAAGIPVVAQAEFDLDLAGIIWIVLIGLVIGIIARVIIPGSPPFGILGTILVGIAGAFIGNYLAGAVFEETAGVDWIASILVAALLVWLLTRFGRRTVR
jgi:uncharacterized membrane protein YeaQ/YmgE (transglycosylase-associated protein family)